MALQVSLRLLWQEKKGKRTCCYCFCPKLPKVVEFTVLDESVPCTWVGSEGRAINLDVMLADSICIFDELVR